MWPLAGCYSIHYEKSWIMNWLIKLFQSMRETVNRNKKIWVDCSPYYLEKMPVCVLDTVWRDLWGSGLTEGAKCSRGSAAQHQGAKVKATFVGSDFGML